MVVALGRRDVAAEPATCIVGRWRRAGRMPHVICTRTKGSTGIGSTRAFSRDNGFRMDFLLLSAEASARLTAAGVHAPYRGREKPSDHAPAGLIWPTVDSGAQRRR